MGNLSSGNTNIPPSFMETANSGTEANFMREENPETATTSIKPVMSGTESPLSSIEPVMNNKAPDSRSMEFVGGETATLGIPMETGMISEVPGHTESLPSFTEATMNKEAPVSPMESEISETNPAQKLTDPNMKTNETPVPSIEPVGSEQPHQSSIMESGTSNQETSANPMEGDKETLVSSFESENIDTEHPAMSIESNTKSTDTSKESEMDDTEKPLSSMDSVVGGREASFNFMESVNNVTEAPVSSMDTKISDIETPLTPMAPIVSNTEVPSGDISGNMVSTSIPVVGEVSQSSDEMNSNNLTGSTSTTTELPSKSVEKIESSSAEPSTVNSTVSPSINLTESQADGSPEISSSQITVSSTEPSPTIMDLSTSHLENSSKITEPSTPLPTNYMSSSNESDTNSTELPPDLMEQFPIQSALS